MLPEQGDVGRKITTEEESRLLRDYERNGRSGRTRTCDPLLRRQMLYPPELRSRNVPNSIVSELYGRNLGNALA